MVESAMRSGPARRVRRAVLLIVGCGLALAASATTVGTRRGDLLAAFGIPNARLTEPDLVTAGQPSPEQLAALAWVGFRTVVDLRRVDEGRGFDEPALVRALELDYVSLPVDPETIDRALVQRFGELVRTARRPLLVHCGSANRVGALYYAYLVLERGVPQPEALAEAHAVGLRQPELEARIDALLTVGP